MRGGERERRRKDIGKKGGEGRREKRRVTTGMRKRYLAYNRKSVI